MKNGENTLMMPALLKTHKIIKKLLKICLKFPKKPQQMPTLDFPAKILKLRLKTFGILKEFKRFPRSFIEKHGETPEKQ